ncbi:MAG: alpha/beta fold hydrolase [Crocinitomicaceae bacterium]|nr:alpha/beta fold hydrolase [Crocinitomicaceae bacterium]
MQKKWLKRILIIFGILVLCYGAFVQWMLPRLIVKVNSWPISWMKETPEEINYSGKYVSRAFSIETSDNLKLKGRIIRADVKSEICVVLVHGIRSRKENYYQIVDGIASNGFDVIVFDQRCHGESEGEYCTFGVKESEDVRQLIQFASEEFHIQKFVLWGQSLGGSVVIQSMNKDDRIIAGISESTFTDYQTIAKEYIQNKLPLFPDAVCDYASKIGAENAGFDPNEASTIEAAEKIRKPILIVHGTEDENINFKYGKQIYESIPSREKQFIPIQGAGHNNLWQIGGENYFQIVINFIKNQ